MSFFGIHFIRPVFLWLLVPASIIYWRFLQASQSNNPWETICDPVLLKALTNAQHHTRQQWPLHCCGIACLVACIALAGPSWQQTSQPVFQTQDAQVIVVDLSPAMWASDLKPSRMARVRFKLKDILQHRQEGQTGMVAFSREAFVVSPLTEDAQTIAAMVPELSPGIMPISGSRITAGLKLAKQLLQQAGVGTGKILLVSASRVSKEDRETAQQLTQQGITTSVLSIGSTAGGPLRSPGGLIKDRQGNILIAKGQAKALRALARAGQGRFAVFSADDQDIETLLAHEPTKTARKQKNLSALLWQDQGRLLVFLLIPLMLLGFRKGWFEELSQ